MNSLTGQIREKTGRSTYKAILLKPLGETQTQEPIKTPTGLANYDVNPRRLRIYRMIAAHYFTPKEMFWKRSKNETYELHLQNTSYERGESHIQYINADSGAPIVLQEIGGIVHGPKTLSRLFKVEHINAAAMTLKSNAGLVIMIVVFAAGFAIGALVFQNMPAITHALSPKATPTPFR